MHLTGSKSPLTFKSTYHIILELYLYANLLSLSDVQTTRNCRSCYWLLQIIVRDIKLLFYVRLSKLKRIVNETFLPRAEEYFSMIIPAGHPLILIRTCLKYSKYLNYH